MSSSVPGKSPFNAADIKAQRILQSFGNEVMHGMIQAVSVSPHDCPNHTLIRFVTWLDDETKYALVRLMTCAGARCFQDFDQETDRRLLGEDMFAVYTRTAGDDARMLEMIVPNQVIARLQKADDRQLAIA